MSREENVVLIRCDMPKCKSIATTVNMAGWEMYFLKLPEALKKAVDQEKIHCCSGHTASDKINYFQKLNWLTLKALDKDDFVDDST